MTDAQQALARQTLHEDRGLGGILNVSDVAQLFGCSPKTVRSWVKDGQIPHFRLPGGHLRFRRAQIEQWINAGCPKP